MLQKIFIALAGVICGAILGYLIILKTNISDWGIIRPGMKVSRNSQEKIVVGFMPFWLLSKQADDYSHFINQLSYFNLTINSDGTIQKYAVAGEADPGWHTLYSGKADEILQKAKSKGIKLSLTVFSANDNNIMKLLEEPVNSARNLTLELSQILPEYGFTDLNIDIEMVSEASPEMRIKYAEFISEVKRNLDKNITITLDLQPIAFVKDKNLSDPKTLSGIADYIILMGYDFHNIGSFVTGPVSPQSGAGIVSEFDIESAVQTALTTVPASKLILAVPLYGYSWETINKNVRSATLPASGYSISNNAVEELLDNCATCSAEFDKTDGENYIVYKDTETGLYHQIFYPDRRSTQMKTDFVKSQNLAGVALWALGYEGKSILEPIAAFRR